MGELGEGVREGCTFVRAVSTVEGIVRPSHGWRRRGGGGEEEEGEREGDKPAGTREQVCWGDGGSCPGNTLDR